jgi:hypothetical protein
MLVVQVFQYYITTDYSVLKCFLQSMNTDMVSVGTLLNEATSCHRRIMMKRKRVSLIMISDGEDHEGQKLLQKKPLNRN